MGVSILKIVGNSHQFRFDHSRVKTTESSAIIIRGNVLGVIDHVAFELNNWKFGVMLHLESWNNTGDFGDASWADDSYIGPIKRCSSRIARSPERGIRSRSTVGLEAAWCSAITN
jgi:hypothetical protein